MNDLYDRKRLDRAFTVSIVSLIGFFIPFLGVILAFVAIGINSGVEAHSEKMENRKVAVYSIAILTIVLSLLAGYGYFKYFQNIREESARALKAEQARLNQEERQQRDYLQQQSLRVSQQRAQLNECLDKVADWYNQNSTGRQPQAYWDRLDSMHAQQIEECQIRYSN